MERSKDFDIIIIPGNPGIKEYYDKFMYNLSSEFKLNNINCDIQVRNHIGHDDDTHERTYSLNDQIDHHKKFVKTKIKSDKKIILIGHSIGCYIILDLLHDLIINQNVYKVFLLFPTIEKLEESPQGKYMTNLLRSRLFLWFISFISFLFCNLTTFKMKCKLFLWYFGCKIHSSVIDGTLVLISRHVLQQVFFMAKTEMDQVKECDWEIIRQNYDRIFMYYGRNDRWCPESLYFDMVARFESENLPTMDLKLDQENMAHAFVISDNEKMAEIISNRLIH